MKRMKRFSSLVAFGVLFSALALPSLAGAHSDCPYSSCCSPHGLGMTGGGCYLYDCRAAPTSGNDWQDDRTCDCPPDSVAGGILCYDYMGGGSTGAYGAHGTSSGWTVGNVHNTFENLSYCYVH